MGIVTPTIRPICQDQMPAAQTTTGVRIIPRSVTTPPTRPSRTSTSVTVVCVRMSVPRLRAEGRRLGIVTAKRHRTVQLAFDRLPGLEANFEVVVGAEDTERHKPDPDPILEALARLGAAPEGSAYVGDSPFDVRAAKSAGAFSVAVAWGGIHDADALEREEPDALVRHAEELLAVL